MTNTFSYLSPTLKSISISPKMVQLFIPPIKWHGDPKGHIGTYDTFFFVISGECSLMIDNDSFILREGDLAFLPREKMRTYTNMSPNAITLYEINFEASIDGANWYEALEFEGTEYVVHPKDTEMLKKLFEDSVRYEFNKDIGYDVLACANLLNIISIFIGERKRAEKNVHPFLPVVSFMKKHLDRNIKISELATVAFMEETYFIRRFKSALGDTPISYLNKLRIYRAMTLLAENALSLTDISRSVGFYDSSYFSKMFKSKCGITPGEYRGIFNK